MVETREFTIKSQIEEVFEIVKFKSDLKKIELSCKIDDDLFYIKIHSDSMRLK